MTAIFISHSNLDKADSKKIKDALQHLGFDYIFLDFDKTTGIGVGEKWEKTLYEEIGRCHVVIVVLTANWLESKWCFVEFAQARALGKIVLPVICGPIPSHSVLPEVQAADAVNLDADGIAKLEMKLLAVSNELARGFKLAPDRSPFPGINSFEQEDAAIFFGRDEETRSIIERLDARRNKGGARMVVIIGASGAGKSSLLKAGILPQIKRRRTQWLVLPCLRLEQRPLLALAKSIAHFMETPGDWKVWYDELYSGTDLLKNLRKLLDGMRIGETRSSTILLPIDQFEELFTIAEPEERDRFLSVLTLALDPANKLPLLVVATGTSDVLQGLIESGPLGMNCETAPLSPMPFDRISRLVEGPATIGGIHVEKGLTELIVGDVEHAEALPLLAYTLYLLHTRSAQAKRLTVGEYRLLGDPSLQLNPIQNSVRLVADETVSALNPGEAELKSLRDAFIPYLVRLRLDDGRRVRQAARLSNLPADSMRLVHALVGARLLTIRSESSLVEVSHEALFKAWPTLDGWLTEEQDFLNDVERLRAAMEVWTQSEESSKAEALLHGLMLTRARDWLSRYPDRFRGHDMEVLGLFISVSAKAQDEGKSRLLAEEQRKKSMQRALVSGSIVSAAIFALVALVAVIEFSKERTANRLVSQEKNRANLERDAALKNQSLLLIDFAGQKYAAWDFETAVELSLAALPTGTPDGNRPFSAEAERMLYQSVTALREQNVLRGHIDQVRSARFSGDGRLLVTAGWDRTARIWDIKSGEPLTILAGHGDRLTSAFFSRTGRRVVTASWDMTARIWNTADGRQLHVLQGHTDEVSSAVFSPDERYVVTASKDGSARIWNADTGAQIAILPHDGPVRGAEFSPDGKTVLTGSEDQTAAIWDAETGKQLCVMRGHQDTVSSASFSRDGKKVVTASWDGTARTWVAETCAQIAVLRGHDGTVLSASFSPDGERIVTSSADRTARIWQAMDGTPIVKMTGHTKQVVGAAFSSDGQYVLTASLDETARVWRAVDGSQVAILKGHEDVVYAASWAPDDRHVATASSDKTARIWAAIDPTEVVALRGLGDAITDVAFSPDGQKLAAASDDHTAGIWDVATGAPLLRLKGHTDRIKAIAFSPDGTKIATAAWDNSVRLWDALDGRQIFLMPGHSDRFNSVAFSPDGRHLVTTSWDRAAQVWDTETGQQSAVLSGHMEQVNAAIFSPDGKVIATASNDGTCRIWNPLNGATLAVMRNHTGWVRMAAFSSDSRRVVTASQDDTARIWDVATGAQLAVLEGHKAQVQMAAFSSDGKYVVTASWDDTARIWDALSGAQLKILRGHKNHVEVAAFLPDGKRVITGSWDGTARIWNADSGAEVATLIGHGDQIHRFALSPDAKSVATASDDKNVKIWPVFASTLEIVRHAQAILPKELSSSQTKILLNHD